MTLYLYSGNMGLDSKIFDDNKDIQNWKDDKGDYYPIFRTFKLLDTIKFKDLKPKIITVDNV